jgi:hypothetical protein
MTASIMQPWFPFTWNFPSGDVDLKSWFSPNVNVTYAGTPAIERDVVERVASFGKQLGILTDAVLELADGSAGDNVQALREIAERVEAIKKAHKSDAKQSAKDAIEQLAKLDKPALLDLLKRYEG